MSNIDSVRCHWCQGTKRIRYCHSCTTVHCENCVINKDFTEFYCSFCDTHCNGSICGTCGNSSQIVNQVSREICSNCESTEISDPEVILKSLPSDYFSSVTKVTDILPKINELNRSFDFFTALVRQCRIAGLLAFPQIENSLKRCSKGMNQINKRTIDQLSNLRKEALFEIFNISYFRNIDITQYRSAERLVKNLNKAIDQTVILVNHWCDEVNNELDKLYRLSDPLRKHYELLQTITRYLPEGIHSIAGIVPAVSMKVKQGKSTQKSDSYIIFSSEVVIFLPKKAISSDEIIVGKMFNYTDIKKINKNKSSIKGSQLNLKFIDGEAVITAPPKVLEGIIHFFELIQSDAPLMIGSAKTILKIEAEMSEKNDIKRACDKFIDVFKERLFGSVQSFDETPTISMTDLQDKFLNLKQTSNEIDNRARNLQINMDDYRHYRKQINDSLRNLRNDFSRLGGHFTSKKDLDQWNIDDLDKYDHSDNDRF